MSFNVANRKVHHWASFIVAVPLLVMIVSGLFLQMKKQWAYVQPPEQRGEVTETKVIASVGDKLRLEHTLEAPVTGRVGFWTKRDSITAFKGFSVR
jgi:uncharacterized iron-regulated membrane protein